MNPTGLAATKWSLAEEIRQIVERYQQNRSSGGSGHVSPRELTASLKLNEINNFDDSAFQLHNIEGTNFPMNTPCYLVGTKGSGKTYLLASIAQYAFNHKLFKRLFYIYAENVDTTLSRAVPRNALYQIPHDVADKFLFKYLSKKTKFCSCYRLMRSIDGTDAVKMGDLIETFIGDNHVYWDNYLNDLVKRKKLELMSELIEYVNKTVMKYSSKQLVLTIDGFSVNVGELDDGQFDMFIIDDIAQFSDLFSTNRRSSMFYRYFTITRQNMTTFYLAGQELQQLPKMYRSQLGALVLLKGVDVVDSLRESKLPKLNVLEIYNKFAVMKIHEGVLINYNTGEVEFIKT